jgi:heme-degrading monooxygenase HmoA
MIARIWRGWTSLADADAYADYLLETGIADYRRTPGNRGAWILRGDVADQTEFATLSFWDSTESIAAFAGDDLERAVFYPEDDRFLVERDTRVLHYDVLDAETEGR